MASNPQGGQAGDRATPEITSDLPAQPSLNVQDVMGTCELPAGHSDAQQPVAQVMGTCDLPAEVSNEHVGQVEGTCDLPPEGSEENTAALQPGAFTSDYRQEDTAHRGRRGTEERGAEQGMETRDRRVEPMPGDATGEYRVDTGMIPGDATGAYLPGETGEPVRGAALRQTANRSPGGKARPSSGSFFGAPTPKGTSRYFLKKFHAKGGMGEIWLAEDTDLGRQVALKRMLRGKQSQQFLREAQVTGQLEHPGVIPIHELSVDERGAPYYVMKFVHGKTLKEVIADYHAGRDTGTPREVQWLSLLNIFLGLCQTVAYAHSRNVIHRDIKPDNVMVGAYGETLVLDWGLAKVIGTPDVEAAEPALQLHPSDDAKATMAGAIKGSPYYFSPEVAEGLIEEVDKISDVYLLGGTLYEILTGKTPRTANTVLELIVLAKTSVPRPPRQLDATIPKPLQAICVKALAHKKEDRYQSAAALAADVQRYLAGEPVSAYQENVWERTWRWLKRHRVLLARTAAGVLFAGMALTAYLLIRDAELRSEEAERVALELKAQERARQEISSFRDLAEEARFYAASAGALTDDAPSMNPAQAELKAREALALADRWGRDLKQLPLEGQRPAVKENLYNLLLEMTQLGVRVPGQEQALAAQKYLDRAAELQTPTRSLYRLRARCLEALGKLDEAQAAKERARDAAIPTTALDHYLQGEQYRQASATAVTPSLTSEADKGEQPAAMTRQDFLNKAVASYRQALEKDANHYWSHYQLGSCYMGLGLYAQAVEALGTCVALRPTTPWGYSTRGFALSHLPERAAEAQGDLEHALQLDPKSRPAQLRRGIVYWRQGALDKAAADFAAVLDPPEDKILVEGYLARGQMYFQNHEYDKALADFDEAVARKLENRTLYLHRARLYLVKEDADKCLKDLTTFVTWGTSLTPEGQETYAARARELRLLALEFPEEARNRREQTYFLALKQLDKALKLGSPNAALYRELGIVSQKLAELRPREVLPLTKQAIAAYTMGLEKNPRDKVMLVTRAWAYSNFEQNDLARKDFAAAIAVDPGDGEAYSGLGYTEAVLKLPVQARRHANQAVLYGAGDYLVLHNVACIFAALAKAEPARAEEYQDAAIDQLQRGLELWKKGGSKKPDARQLIRGESAFGRELRKRAEFQKLLSDK